MSNINSKGRKRTVIIGIDGVPFRLMDALSKNGTMPNFASLREEGEFRQMESSIPEISSVSWSSIITGRNPGEHGIFGFTDMIPGTYTMSFPNFRDLKSPAFWQNSEKRHVIINVPSTYPAQQLNGFLVSGFVSLDLEKATYPQSYVPKLKELGYQIDVDAAKGHKSKSLLLEELFRVHGLRMKAARYLWKSMDWDVFMLVFTGSDRIGHFLWDAYEDPNHEHHQRFLDYFAEIDKAIGEIASRMRPEDRLLMCSDHGMELSETNINVNRILQESGYLSIGSEPGRHFNNIREGTRAFAMDPGRIYFHYKDRYPGGSIRVEEASELQEELTAFFLKAEANGKPVVVQIHRGHDIYSGPMLHRAPDLVCMPEKNIAFSARIQSTDYIEETTLTGKHSFPDAFFFCRTPKNIELPDRMRVENMIAVLENCGALS